MISIIRTHTTQDLADITIHIMDIQDMGIAGDIDKLITTKGINPYLNLHLSSRSSFDLRLFYSEETSKTQTSIVVFLNSFVCRVIWHSFEGFLKSINVVKASTCCTLTHPAYSSC